MDTKISYSAIYAAFDGDEEIGTYCDPSIKDLTPKGVSDDVCKKILDYEDIVDGVFKTIKVNEKEIGFVYYFDDVLVSFGVNKEYRKKDFLRTLFVDIISWIGNDFTTYMWRRNKRAIEWLERCGMAKEEFELDNVVKLRYKRCL